ncbi:MAG: SGNH/GDSL hydrolase family protein [Chthoniobacterales bacterium]
MFTSIRNLIAAAAIVVASLTFSSRPVLAQQTPPAFSQIILFGDSLSDTGNVNHRIEDITGGQIGYPSGSYNYSNGRFTNSTDTDPPARKYVGVWHEQMARLFLNLPAATNSEDGGLNYAFGGATLENGTQTRSIEGSPVTVTIDNIGKQIDDFLANHTFDPNALYILWGGGNDLRTDESATNVTATANRVSVHITRLAQAGAKYILVPNVPAIGTIPQYIGNDEHAQALDVASLSYRDQLKAVIDTTVANLAAQKINVTVYQFDEWRSNLQIYADPATYGFINVTNSAQGRSDFNPDQFVFWDDVHPTTAGHYYIAKAAYAAITGPTPSPAKAANLSTRLNVGTDQNVSIIGFIVTGDVAKKVILRGLGPSLAAKGVTGYLADPTLALYDANNNVVASNDNWEESQAVEIAATGIPPENPNESAIVATLAPGKYTAVLAGKNGGTGVGLVEAYDGDNNASTLANLSTRGSIGIGEDVMIGGFIVGSGDNPLIVIRAIGPSLSSGGVNNPLADPVVELHNGNGTLLRANDNWKDNPAEAQAARSTTIQPTDDHESAITAFLPSGNYTAVVRGANNTIGVASVEIYRLR